MKLLLHQPFYLLFFLFLFFSLFYSAKPAPAATFTTNASDEVATTHTQPFGRPVEGAQLDTMSNALKGEEKQIPEVLKNADQKRKKVPYFFRVIEDSSKPKKKVLVAFIPSKKRSSMVFVKEIVRQIFRALPFPLSSKIFNSSHPNDINTRAALIPSFNDGRVHEIFNMMGCKKERVVKDASSNSSSESWIVCILKFWRKMMLLQMLSRILLRLFESRTSTAWGNPWIKPSYDSLGTSQDFNFIFKSSIPLLMAGIMTIKTPVQYPETPPTMTNEKEEERMRRMMQVVSMHMEHRSKCPITPAVNSESLRRLKDYHTVCMVEFLQLKYLAEDAKEVMNAQDVGNRKVQRGTDDHMVDDYFSNLKAEISRLIKYFEEEEKAESKACHRSYESMRQLMACLAEILQLVKCFGFSPRMTHEAKLEFLRKVTDYHQAQAEEILALMRYYGPMMKDSELDAIGMICGHGVQETESEREEFKRSTNPKAIEDNPQKQAYYERMNDYILYLKTEILELTECFEKRQSMPRMNYDMENYLSLSEEAKKLYSLIFNDVEDHKKGEGPTNDRMAYSYGHEDEEFLKASVPEELDMIDKRQSVPRMNYDMGNYLFSSEDAKKLYSLFFNDDEDHRKGEGTTNDRMAYSYGPEDEEFLKASVPEELNMIEKRQSMPRMNYDMENYLSSSEEAKKLYSLFFNDDEDHKKGEGPTNDRMAYSYGHEDEEFLKASVPEELDMIEKRQSMPRMNYDMENYLSSSEEAKKLYSLIFNDDEDHKKGEGPTNDRMAYSYGREDEEFLKASVPEELDMIGKEEETFGEEKAPKEEWTGEHEKDGREEEALEEERPGEFQKDNKLHISSMKGQEEDPKEEKVGESFDVASLRTNNHQWSHVNELAERQENIPACINIVTSESARTSAYQDSEVSTMHVDAHLNEMLTGQQRSFNKFGKYTFTLQRNCLRIFWLFALITALVIIITICYMPRGNFIISTPKLELSASKETQEFIQHRSGSRVLLPTRTDMQTEGKEKELGKTRSTKHAGSLRESKVITSSSNANAKLRIVIPIKKGFHEFIKISFDTENNRPLVTGFIIDVFNEVMKTFPNQVSWEFIPYEASYKDATGYYDNLAHQINLKSQEQSYDVVVGDVTITTKRSKYGAFSHPFLLSEISMIVPIEDDNDVTCLWWFFKPLSAEMWIVTFVFFLLKGVLLCLLEDKKNQASQWKNVFSFLFARRWKLERGSSRFIVDLWTVGLFIIGAAYNANLSMLLSNGTPHVINTNLETLIENGDNVGYPNGSFVFGLLKQWGFHESKLKAYSTEKEYVKALSLGSAKNGVSAIVDEIPYIRVFLNRYGHQYAMGVLNRKIKGRFSFVFPKDSKIMRDISEGIV